MSPWLTVRDAIRRADGSTGGYAVVDSADTALVIPAGRLTPLGTLDVMPSTLSQRCWVFLATELTHGPPDRDPEEQDMESIWFTRPHLERMIKNSYITDAKTCAAYTLLLLHEQAPRG